MSLPYSRDFLSPPEPVRTVAFMYYGPCTVHLPDLPTGAVCRIINAGAQDLTVKGGDITVTISPRGYREFREGRVVV